MQYSLKTKDARILSNVKSDLLFGSENGRVIEADTGRLDVFHSACFASGEYARSFGQTEISHNDLYKETRSYQDWHWGATTSGCHVAKVVRSRAEDRAGSVKTAPSETKTLSRLSSIEMETRPRHLEVKTKTRPRLYMSK